MSDEQTITALRRAADAAVRDHHLGPGLAAAAWSVAQAPRQRVRRRVAVAASVLGAAAAAAALAVWGTSGEHANPPAGGSACAVTTARLPTWAQAGFFPAGLHTPHVVSGHRKIIAVLFGPLRVHQPAGTHNKVLWVAKTGSGPLHIRAQLEGTSRTVTRTLPEIGPSYVNMPAAGCWRLSLNWNPYHDTIALRYRPGP